MLSIVDEILTQYDALGLFINFQISKINLEMSKILQLMAEGKTPQQVTIKVGGTYPNHVFLVMYLVDGRLEAEEVSEALCDELASKISGINQEEFLAYKLTKVKTKALKMRKDAEDKPPTGNEPK
ncbi:hypothetical protein DR64_1624 [Paraburkholderia xenovorans LB400]|jgi:hypothetical protein|uniref:Uncharacterized protein n=1 Tax=Paraburkholderia xenovorans (strain LB400) TaxID=266265 RepID=Q145D9_PARXL|nr:hypothetical protein [Paraburkholderia xenovorans]ABE29050.1 hypothetical protein Bxe_A3949 [Paraburkholderia xenovorans LB400]AIP33725.1 hypothetical protein DR64_1624 [Paraburkholderia xenovorans LB400]